MAMLRGVRAGLVGLGLWAFAPVLVAEEGSARGPVQLEYRAAQGCPTEAAFRDAVAARGGRLDAAPPEMAGARLRTELQSDGRAFVGQLELIPRTADGARGLPEPQAREVHATECAAAMRGLAVIAALVLQPHAAVPASATERAGSPPAPQPAVPQPAVPQPVVPQPVVPARDPQRLSSIGQFSTERVNVGPGTLVFGHNFSYTLSAGASLGILPGVAMPRYDFTIARANFVTTPEGSNYLVAGWLPRVRWTLLGNGTYEANGFWTRASGIRGGFGGCTSFIYDLGGWVALGCADFSVGVLRLESGASGARGGQSKKTGTGTVGLDVETQYNIGAFHFDLRLGTEALVTKATAERPDGSQIVSTRLLSGLLTAGVGFHF